MPQSSETEGYLLILDSRAQATVCPCSDTGSDWAVHYNNPLAFDEYLDIHIYYIRAKNSKDQWTTYFVDFRWSSKTSDPPLKGRFETDADCFWNPFFCVVIACEMCLIPSLYTITALFFSLKYRGVGGDTGIDFLLLLSGICLRKGLIFLISGGEFLFSTGLLAVLVMTCYLTVKVYILVSLSCHLVWGNDI